MTDGADTSAAMAMQQQLLDAHAAFQRHRPARQLFLECDLAARVAPQALVGRQVRVLWPEDEAWYLGTVAAYDPAAAEHTVHYDDGQKEPVVAALERARLLVHAGEVLPAPSPLQLREYAAALAARADRLKGKGKTAELRRRAAELREQAAEEEEEAEEGEVAHGDGAVTASVKDGPAVELVPEPQAMAVDVASASDDATAAAAAAPQPAEPAEPPPLPSAPLEELPQQQRAPSPPPPDPLRPPEPAAAAVAAACTPPPAPPLDLAPPAEASEASELGDVVWAKVNGFPPWPALVVTREQLGKPLASGLQLRALPIVYFGTFECQLIKRAAVTPLAEGVAAGFHANKSNKRRLFAAALCEMAAFMQDGELPEGMLPPNNDGFDGSSSDEDAPGGGRRPAKRARAAGAGAGARPGGAPFFVGRSLQVLSLGRVEWLHPLFHNEKCIWPVGYAAERTASTPAGGPKPAPHLCEILEAEDGSGPLFRVTPKGRPPVEGATPSKAWAALFEGAARGLGAAGLRMFGLAAPEVARAIEALPGAALCERYAGWPDGEAPPPPPPLDAAAARARLAAEARAQRLPPGVRAVPAAPTRPGVCYVCLEEDEDEEDLVLQCDGCGVFVHMSCYAVPEPPHGALWLCDTCGVGAAPPPPCAMCPVVGGALKRTTCGRWCHPSCALWVPQTALDPGARHLGLRGLIQGVGQIPAGRTRLTCQLCRQPHGACMQCCDPACYASFHIMCARQAGYVTQLVDASDSDSEGEGGGEGGGGRRALPPPPPPPLGAALQMALADSSGAAAGAAACAPRSDDRGSCGSADENAGGAANGVARARRRPPPGSGGRRRDGRKPASTQQQGTKVSGARLLVFCPRHTPAGATPLAAAPPPPPPTAARADAAAPATQQPLDRQRPAKSEFAAPAPGGAAAASRPRRSGGARAGGAPAAPAAADPAAPARREPPPPAPGGCARAIPFCGAQRRGHRAPEALAAAASKRTYVQATPLLVGGPRLMGGRREVPPSSCTWHPRPAALPQQAEPDGQEAGKGGEGAFDPGEEAEEGLVVAVAPPLPPRAAAAAAGVRSAGERFYEMRRTLARRVVPGKSAIHGWGAFAREPHAKGAMVIEYVGELVRPAVADARERRCYDSLVGAGTYVFRLNAARCVDATRAGNLAHLLNHSCQPNCFSRTLPVLGAAAGAAEDHVVISALRELEAGEELTYDYRFSGDEQLRCNCGAARCRGMVNQRPPARGALVPRSQTRPFVPPASPAAGAEGRDEALAGCTGA